jgi:hypothetical protein
MLDVIRPSGNYYSHLVRVYGHLAMLWSFWADIPLFGKFCQEKSGNPVPEEKRFQTRNCIAAECKTGCRVQS